MKEGGRILASVLHEVIKIIKPGISTAEFNSLAEKLIKKSGGHPSFKGYKAAWSAKPYPAALCVSINSEVVHGIPSRKYLIKEGDVVGLDCGLEYENMFTDSAKTVIVGKGSKEVVKLVSATQEALTKGIEQVKMGNYISDISKAIEDHIKKNGFSVIRQLVGHGVGYSAHEEPQIPNYVDKNFIDVELKEGMTLALEPMASLGDWPVETKDDGWTMVTTDKSVSAHFEHTVVVTKEGVEILTK